MSRRTALRHQPGAGRPAGSTRTASSLGSPRSRQSSAVEQARTARDRMQQTSACASSTKRRAARAKPPATSPRPPTGSPANRSPPRLSTRQSRLLGRDVRQRQAARRPRQPAKSAACAELDRTSSAHRAGSAAGSGGRLSWPSSGRRSSEARRAVVRQDDERQDPRHRDVSGRGRRGAACGSGGARAAVATVAHAQARHAQQHLARRAVDVDREALAVAQRPGELGIDCRGRACRRRWRRRSRRASKP